MAFSTRYTISFNIIESIDRAQTNETTYFQ